MMWEVRQYSLVVCEQDTENLQSIKDMECNYQFNYCQHLKMD